MCSLYATAYHWAVSNFGDGSFHGAESLSDPKTKEIGRFIKYIEKHPSSFDLDEAIRLLNKLQAGPQPRSQIVTFEAFTPALVVFQQHSDGRSNVIEIKGKLPK